MHRPILAPTRRGGVDDGTRTRDGRNHNPGLYQLSYVHHRRTSDFEMARPAGIEPATAGLEGRCSIRLSYGRFINQQVIAPNVIFSGRCSGPKQTESEVRADYIGVCRYLKRPMSSGRAALHRQLELRQRVVPLLADELQGPARLIQLGRLKFPQPLSADFDIPHQARGSQHP
jgi:hypothetical protein